MSDRIVPWRERIRRWLALFSALWLLTVVLLLLLEYGYENLHLRWWGSLYLLLTLLASGIAFVAYGVDKRRARSAESDNRISERMLHLLDFVGGWPGGAIAQWMFRHKTQKMSFRLVFWITVLLHTGLIGYVAYTALFGTSETTA